MLNKREWLVSQGLAQGTRGRFSSEAEAAWREHTGNLEEVPAGDMGTSVFPGPEPVDPNAHLPRDGFHLAKPVTTRPVIRKENLAYTIDDEGRMVAHGECGRCNDRINRCHCKNGPWGLRYIDKGQRPYLVIAEEAS